MPLIHVCPLSKVGPTVRQSGARTLVTLIDHGVETPRPAEIARHRHLVISVSDVIEETDGCVAPGGPHVADLLDFARAWDRREPLVVHCFAGVSRSTAAAFLIACALEPNVAESVFARAIRANSKTANPNALIVSLGDRALDRKGRMIAALRAMGPAAPSLEAAPFSFSLRPDAP